MKRSGYFHIYALYIVTKGIRKKKKLFKKLKNVHINPKHRKCKSLYINYIITKHSGVGNFAYK